MAEQAPPRPRRSYVMHGAIAAGGMATVHLGRLVGHGGFARTVAIKRLHPQLLADPEVAATFTEEARLSARVAHVNVAAMLDVVVDGDELLLVMEYVHGETLSRLLGASRRAGEAVPVSVVCSVLCDTLHGLHAAHEATHEDGSPLQLVHRDVSPQNVIVGVDGVARVVDFGIAKAVGRAQITREGQVRGKVPYMAPEQLLRRAIDRRTDVYAAGVVAWEALAGRRLFDADDEPTLFSKVLEDVVPAPSALRPDVPAALDAVIMRALARNPDERFATARDMAVAIEAAGVHAPASAVADWVTRVAGPALAARSAKIAEMERESQVQPESSSALVRAPSASIALLAVDARAGSESEPSAAPSPVAHTHLVTPAGASRRGRAYASVAIVVVAALGISGALAARRPAQAGAPAMPVEPPAVSTAAAAPPPAASAPAEVATAESVATPVEPTTRRAVLHRRPHAPTAAQWCKVFDPDKGVFVMKSMRVARCP